MKPQWILPAIACAFILMAIYHLTVAGKHFRRSDDASHIKARVRKKIGAVFMLVGAGLLGFYWLTL